MFFARNRLEVLKRNLVKFLEVAVRLRLLYVSIVFQPNPIGRDGLFIAGEPEQGIDLELVNISGSIIGVFNFLA